MLTLLTEPADRVWVPGHLAVAVAALDELGLDRVLLAPTWSSPHKPGPLAPPALRLAWCRALVAPHPRLEVWDGDVRRAVPTRTVDTLRDLTDTLTHHNPTDRSDGVELVFQLGSDAFAQLGSWVEPGTCLTLARFAVVTRDGDRPPELPAHLAAHRSKVAVWAASQVPAGLSSTRVRAALTDPTMVGECWLARALGIAAPLVTTHQRAVANPLDDPRSAT